MNKSILKPPRKKLLLDDSFCSFNNKGDIKSFAKSYMESVGCLYMQPTIAEVDFEHKISIKVDSKVDSQGHRVLGHSSVYNKAFH